MDQQRIPKPGEIYMHFKGMLYQIITVAIHSETREYMVVYQALYGEFKTYVRPLDMFLSKVDKEKYPEVKQQFRFTLRTSQEELVEIIDSDEKAKPQQMTEKNTTNVIQATSNQLEAIVSDNKSVTIEEAPVPSEEVNSILLDFLDAPSYSRKLEILTSNIKNLNDRLINDMAVALDCSVDDGPIEQRIQGLIVCLQAMRRFEDRRLR